MKLKKLAAQIAMGAVLIAGPCSMPAYAVVPVIDGANLAQNVITAIEAVAQTAKMIEEIALIKEQLDDMIKNSLLVKNQVWDTEIVGKVEAVTETIEAIDPILEKIGDLSQVFGGETPSENYVLKLEEESNKAFKHAVGIQKGYMKADTEKLAALQKNAAKAEGRMQALQYENQFSALTVSKLTEIQDLLITEQMEKAREKQQETIRKAMVDEVIVANTETSAIVESKPQKWSWNGVK